MFLTSNILFLFFATKREVDVEIFDSEFGAELIPPDLESCQSDIRGDDRKNRIELVSELGREVTKIQEQSPGWGGLLSSEKEDFGVWNVFVYLVGFVFLEQC